MSVSSSSFYETYPKEKKPSKIAEFKTPQRIKMASIIRKLSFRSSRSSSPTKDTFFEKEEDTQPVKLQLGNYSLVYKDQKWKSEQDGELLKAVDSLTDRNKTLETENQIMKFKIGVLMDMLAACKLDMCQLQLNIANGGEGGQAAPVDLNASFSYAKSINNISKSMNNKLV